MLNNMTSYIDARLQEKCSRIHLDRDFSKGSERILNNLCELGEILGVPEITLGRYVDFSEIPYHRLRFNHHNLLRIG
jgi:hypothetical protein